jgi:imidazolonepropionase-like amidohydrolase
MADWDLLLTDARIATMRSGDMPYGAIEGGAVAISNGEIAWLGPVSELPAGNATETRSLDGCWITPALIDCHTHLVFGGNRASEFEQRLQGASYEEISRSGGGIVSTVRATRSETEECLLASATARARTLLRDGVATVEVKSGYGLDLENEIKSQFGALSADHLEFTSAAGVDAMHAAGTIAVLLPGAYVTLGETQQPPVEAMRSKNVPIAVATDCNPGTSPLLSVREAMALACRVFALTPEEALAATTRVAAAALGLAEDRGTLEIGKRADIAIWNIEHPRDLSYWFGTQPLASLLINGRTANLA